MDIWYFSSDLMFTSRASALATQAGTKLRLFTSAAALANAEGDAPALVIIDLEMSALDLPALVRELRTAAPQAKLLAYGPHVDHARLAAAQAAGCDQVLSNGELHRRMGEIMRGAA
jgi:DNA-binding NarL/FixJ family response regulator